MIFYLLNQILSSTVAFIYPAYASFKTLSQRPANEEQLEHWLMYWAVLGCIMTAEYTAEWAIAWFPFYYLFKLFFLLWLALPQTQGSTYLYTQVLVPFLTRSEPQIDQYINDIKSNLYAFIRKSVTSLWDKIVAVVAQQTGINLNAVDPTAVPPTSTRAPTAAAGGNTSANQRLGTTAEVALGLWRAWGPSVMGAIAQAKELGQQPAPAPVPAPIPHSLQQRPSQAELDLEARRRALEIELATLNSRLRGDHPPPSHSGSSVNLHQSVYLSDSSDSEGRRAGLRNRGKYEEIKRDELNDDEEGDGHSSEAPAPAAGWFGGWGRRSSGYERVKSD